MLKKWSFGIVIALFFSFLGVKNASANSISSIDKTVLLEKDGTAHVTEVWQTTLSQGTEGYQSFSDMRGKTIENFRVSDDSGTDYEPQDSWDTKASFQEKAYKSGINLTADGLELCWGISKYGARTYTLTYDIKNLVTLYSDGVEGIHFDFIKMDQTVYNASVTIKMADETPLTKENSRIWGFGYEGEARFGDDLYWAIGDYEYGEENKGTLVFSTSEALKGESYLKVLIRLQTNLFDDEKLITASSSFDEVYEEAMKDSEYAERRRQEEVNERLKKDRERTKEERRITLFVIAIIVVPLLIAIIARAIARRRSNRVSLYHATPNLESKSIKLPKESEIAPSPDIPCDKNIFLAYFLMDGFEINTESKRRQGLVGALFLKLILEKKLSFDKSSEIYWQKGKNEFFLDLSRATSYDQLESRFITFLQHAAGKNNLLESTEFKQWSKENYLTIIDWFNDVIARGRSICKEKGYVANSESHFGVLTKSASEEATKLVALKNYLNSFETVREDLGAETVSVWEEYLIFAELFGVAEKVQAEFKRLYPEIYKEYFGEADFGIINSSVSNFADDFYHGMTAGIAAAKAISSSHSSSSSDSSSSYSGSSDWSGGGGSSSSSGGGSSGGSSGGGFR
ncbi:DUF2207 domain-containing protein [Candidatus Saccharibacteria bacterium]|nr:DUF2207 domain-containing protein [Candidatus Saccharibacteria bacterium]